MVYWLDLKRINKFISSFWGVKYGRAYIQSGVSIIKCTYQVINVKHIPLLG